MSFIPIDINESTIIGLVFNNLFLCYFEALSVLEITFAHIENFLCLLAS